MQIFEPLSAAACWKNPLRKHSAKSSLYWHPKTFMANPGTASLHFGSATTRYGGCGKTASGEMASERWSVNLFSDGAAARRAGTRELSCRWKPLIHGRCR